MSPQKRQTFQLILCLLVGTPVYATPTATEPPLLFGVLNQQSALKTAQRWNPILTYLSEHTGIPLQLKLGVSVKETDAMMGRGEFDLVFTNHNFRQEYDGPYKVIARWAGPPIQGVIAVRADAPEKTLADLAGKRIAFPSSEAFVAYAVPVTALREAKVTYKTVFAGTQEGALAQLKARQVEAAAVNSRFLRQYSKQYGLAVNTLFISEDYAELPVIAHRRMPAERIEVLRKALLGMRLDPRAATALRAAESHGFEAAGEHDYDNVRRIYRNIRE